MKLQRVLNTLVVLALAAALLPAQAVTAAVPPPQAPAGEYVPGELIVGLTAATTTAARAQASALAGELGAQVVEVNGADALLHMSPDTDLNAAAQSLLERSALRYAEPNRIFRIPEQSAGFVGGEMNTQASTRLPDGSTADAALAEKQAMRTRKTGRIRAVYPSEKASNWGWWYTGANVVWPDTTPSKTVCVIDTGVDYRHKDLAGKILKGRDFVNDDPDPMDDNGHGTHVAGIIAAATNNGEGISGISTGKVLAVKAVDAQGTGSLWDIALAIEYCADQTGAYRADVINLSLGTVGYSGYLASAIEYAGNKGKLVVAAAGNNNTYTYCAGGDLRLYPAGLAAAGPTAVDESCAPVGSPHSAYENVLSVGAYDPDGLRAGFSNYGPWVQWAAPGESIYSTTPWDRPFYMGSYEGVRSRYSSMNGTSMAAPHVAAIAARVWGYMAKTNPAASFQDVKTRLADNGLTHGGGAANWPAEQGPLVEPLLAASMMRGMISARVFDASSGVPLLGAAVTAYQIGAASDILRANGVVSSYHSAWVDLINLPASANYRLKVNKAGYTYGAQTSFVGPTAPDGTVEVRPGEVVGAYGNLLTAVPPKTGNFTGVVQWTSDPAVNFDLALYIPPDGGLGEYVVSAGENVGSSFGQDEGTIGTLSSWPYARVMYADDELPWEMISIKPRPGLAALPYYQGTYTFRFTDINAPASMEAFNQTFVLWKNGKALRVDRTCSGFNGWWNILSITSSASGAAAVQAINTCTGAPVYP